MIAAIARFIGTLLSALLPAILDYLRPKSEIAKPNPELQKGFTQADEELYKQWKERQRARKEGKP